MTVKCDYCGKDAELVTGDVIYPHRSDLAPLKFWRCEDCEAYVGCHKQHPKWSPNGDTPLGRLANAQLREAKSVAHRAFDPLWKHDKSLSRKQAYAWLANQLGIEVERCHIGMFDVETCLKVIKISHKQAALKNRKYQVRQMHHKERVKSL